MLPLLDHDDLIFRTGIAHREDARHLVDHLVEGPTIIEPLAGKRAIEAGRQAGFVEAKRFVLGEVALQRSRPANLTGIGIDEAIHCQIPRFAVSIGMRRVEAVQFRTIEVDHRSHICRYGVAAGIKTPDVALGFKAARIVRKQRLRALRFLIAHRHKCVEAAIALT